MFKFCNECCLCKKYYNDDSKNKDPGELQMMLPQFINNDYEINISNEKLTEEYMFTSGDKGLPPWYFYEDEFIYSCSGSILKGKEGSTSSWNGCSSNTNFTSYFITNYGKLVHIDLSYNRKNITIKYPWRGSFYFKYADIILNKTKINLNTLDTINMLYEIPGLFIHKDNNLTFNPDIIYTVVHTYKSAVNELENKDEVTDKQLLTVYTLKVEELENENNKLNNENVKLNYENTKLKSKNVYLLDFYEENFDNIKLNHEKDNLQTSNIPVTEELNKSIPGNKAILRNQQNKNKKISDTDTNTNMFLNPGIWN